MSTTISSAVDTSQTAIIAQKQLYSTAPTHDEKDAESVEDFQVSKEDSKEEQAQIESDSGDSFEIDDENYIKTNELTEAALINSDFFEAELLSAFENIQEIAKIDRQRMLTCAVSEYIKSVGAEPSPEMVSDALQTFDFGIEESDEEESESESESETEENEEEKAEELDESDISEAESEIEEDIAPISADVFESEFAQALANVRSVAKADQEIFVNNLCDTFVEITGGEATVTELSAIFGRIKESFADEAREAFMEEEAVSSGEESEGSEDSDSDSDFEPNEEDILKTIAEDEKVDAEEEDEANESDEDYVPENNDSAWRYPQDVQDSEEFESDESESESGDITIE